MGPASPLLIELPALELFRGAVHLARDSATYRAGSCPQWIYDIAQIVGRQWQRLDPEECDRQRLWARSLIGKSPFNRASLKTRERGWHRDKGDLGPGWIAYIGDFSGGEFETVGAKPLEVRPNTALCYNPTELHRSLPFTGTRVAIILKAKTPPYL